MDETRRYSFSSTTNFGVWTNRERGNCNSLVYTMIGRIISAIVAFFFATVGCLVGCMVGAIIGHATETGFFRGAGVGAITGAVFSIEAFESSVVLWRSDDTGMKSVLYTIDIIASLISGRLVRERVGISMMNAVQSQMITVELEAAFEETHDIFETEEPRGLPEETVEKIPKLTITEKTE